MCGHIRSRVGRSVLVLCPLEASSFVLFAKQGEGPSCLGKDKPPRSMLQSGSPPARTRRITMILREDYRQTTDPLAVPISRQMLHLCARMSGSKRPADRLQPQYQTESTWERRLRA